MKELLIKVKSTKEKMEMNQFKINEFSAKIDFFEGLQNQCQLEFKNSSKKLMQESIYESNIQNVLNNKDNINIEQSLYFGNFNESKNMYNSILKNDSSLLFNSILSLASNKESKLNYELKDQQIVKNSIFQIGMKFVKIENEELYLSLLNKKSSLSKTAYICYLEDLLNVIKKAFNKKESNLENAIKLTRSITKEIFFIRNCKN